jgi:hypothetical protein
LADEPSQFRSEGPVAPDDAEGVRRAVDQHDVVALVEGSGPDRELGNK